MKSKLMLGALPALFVAGTLTAYAQDPTPPTPAPADKQEAAPAPSPTAPEAPALKAPSTDDSAAPAAETPAAPDQSVEAPAAPDKSADAAATSGSFATEQSATEMRSTKIVGLDVYNARNEKIGDINDLLFGNDGKVASAVIGVGGFLGMGEKLVAVPFADLTFSRDGDGNLRVTIASTKEALESAPDFKYYEMPRT
jgi:type IV secretory pathway VirB10-like protein